MPEESRDCGCGRNNGCGCLGNLFGGCGCGDSSILFFIIIFYYYFVIAEATDNNILKAAFDKCCLFSILS